jgi:hypothetical protein
MDIPLAKSVLVRFILLNGAASFDPLVGFLSETLILL